MKRTWLFVLIALLTAGMLFAGGAKEEPEEVKEAEAAVPSVVTTLSGPVSIEFWHAMSSKLGETVVVLTDKFNSTVGKEMGITVTPVFQGNYNEMKQKTTAAIKAGTAPAIAQAYPDWVAEYMQAEVIVPLNDYIFHPEVGIKDFEDIFPGYLEENRQYTTEGIYYSLPFNKSTEVLFYNKTFFEQNGYSVPKTWNELVALAKKIYETTGKPGFGYDSLDNYM
ncbi:MAG: extracellular solute-binding protein, partial [Spirochaetales bacterium]|nr:extracellular solute-binding protein [Spirochaetales bacterium]